MIQSMTGYGKAENEYADKKIVVEIKSLNSKQIDLSTRISSVYKSKEIELRNIVTQQLLRGKIDLTINVERKGQNITGQQINTEVLKGYVQQINTIAEQTGIKQPDNWFELLLTLPDVLKPVISEADEQEYSIAALTLQQAIDHLTEFRKQEGRSLDTMFRQKIANISALLKEVEKYEKERVSKIRERIEENLKTLSEKVDIDHNRLEQEMIYYIEKLDVNEEKVRLRNHLSYFIETLEQEEGAGKKLGFIAQEMGREINTLGSKSNHSEMQKIVVMMKDELEQIKEQVLNVL